jgi:AcrR family transcriptional regulator
MTMASAESTVSLGAWDRRRIRTSLEIECVGLELIAQRGLGSVTVDQIAQAAGISPRTFFRYFRNVPDVLTALPKRETGKTVARPADEDLLTAFRGVYRSLEPADAGDADDGIEALEARALSIWSKVVRDDPDAVRRYGSVLEVLTKGIESVVRSRNSTGSDDGLTEGAVATALSAVTWFAYVHWVEHGEQGPLSAHLDLAFTRLGESLSRDAVSPAAR